MATVAKADKITVSLDQAEPLVIDVLKPFLVPMLVSSPGIGKSALAYQIANRHKLMVIDVRLSQADPTDLNGFPWITTNDDGVQKKIKAGYVPMETFPVVGDELPEGYDGWLLLMDEMNSCTKAVEAASYKIVLDRMVGQHKLHPKCMVMAAGNLKTDKAIVNTTGTAMQSRLIWLEIHACIKAWLKWADKPESDIDHRVKSFLQFKPDLLHKFDPNHSDRTFPCPRTWEFMSKIIKPWKMVGYEKTPLLAGTVGVGPSREFYSYCQVFEEIPSFEAIIKNPEGVTIGNEPSIHYALAGMVGSRMCAANTEPLIKFVSRLGVDFQVATIRSAIARDREIKKTDSFKTWFSRNAKELVY